MTQIPRERRFVMVANRFRWETRAPLDDFPDQPGQDIPEREGDARFEDVPLYERVHCGVTFDRVKSVQYRGFRRSDSDRILNLLALVRDDEGVALQFSEDAALRLRGPRVVCHLEDLGDPWPTRWRPDHAKAADEGRDSADSEGGET